LPDEGHTYMHLAYDPDEKTDPRSNRHDRQPTWSPANPDGRFRAYGYEELVSRDKASLDIFWLKDESLADSDNLPPPDVIAREIVQDLEAALEQFRLVAGD
jgi:type I restriction enzyme M protein